MTSKHYIALRSSDNKIVMLTDLPDRELYRKHSNAIEYDNHVKQILANAPEFKDQNLGWALFNNNKHVEPILRDKPYPVDLSEYNVEEEYQYRTNHWAVVTKEIYDGYGLSERKRIVVILTKKQPDMTPKQDSAHTEGSKPLTFEQAKDQAAIELGYASYKNANDLFIDYAISHGDVFRILEAAAELYKESALRNPLPTEGQTTEELRKEVAWRFTNGHGGLDEDRLIDWVRGTEVSEGQSETQEEMWDEIRGYINVKTCNIAQWAKDNFTISRKRK